MSTTYIIMESFAWTGLVLITLAFFTNNLTRLRIISVAGAILLGIYYIVTGVPVGIATNIIIGGINIYYLLKEKKDGTKITGE